MSSHETPHLDLSLLAAAQAQKHVTVNEALVRLDAAAQIAVASATQPAPPADAPEGARFLVPVPGEGEAPVDPAWRGREGALAIRSAGGWQFLEPAAGFVVWIADAGVLTVHDGTSFVPVKTGAVPDDLRVASLGVGTDADATNRLAVRGDATLLTHDGSGHRIVVNRAGPDDTASLLFQTDWTGAAEMGLAGGDFAVKVSADGAGWHDALRTDAATGAVSLPRSPIANGLACNLMQDGGRLAGVPESSTPFVGAFEKPGWLSIAPGATFSQFGLFHRNSQTYGGTGPALLPDVKDLVDLLYVPDMRRYASEFYVAVITASDGGAARTFDDGVVRHVQCNTASRLRPVRATFSYYVKSLDREFAMAHRDDRTVLIDGETAPDDPVVPADGAWHHVVEQDTSRYDDHWRYSFNFVRMYGEPGDRLLFALPALFAGTVHVPSSAGHVPTEVHW